MSEIKEDEKFLKAFKQHGIEFIRAVDEDNWVADCPFSGGKEKFYVNKETGQWDSKNTGRKGNLYTFLEQWYMHCLGDTKPEDLTPLCKSRITPINAFTGSVAHNPLTNQYMIPCYGPSGRISDVAMYSLRGKGGLRRTAKTSLGINGLTDLRNSPREFKILVFEGEWDWYIAKWLHTTMQAGVVCLCLPGAGSFKEEWYEYFRDRDVYFCYDSDGPGHAGENKSKVLRTIAKSVQYIAWPEAAPEGFDFRDFIVNSLNGNPSAAGKGEITKCYKLLYSMFGPDTWDERNRPKEERGQKSDPNIVIPHHTELETIFKKWMQLDTVDPIAVVFGTFFANKLEGDPVWTFLVGPPSSNKTEFLLSLSKSKFIETTSTLTPTSLISGLRFADGQPDPSLIPRLDGRVLVIKDFTTILNHNSYVRDDIFGILRDAYDGKCEKIFGTGIKKSFESKFGIISGVTPAIDAFSTMNASLGERFIKYRLDEAITEEVEISRMMRAFENINREKIMREEIQAVGLRMAEKPLPQKDKIPTWTKEITDIIIGCARFTAIMRGSNNKDRFTREQTTKPVREIAIRLAKQYMKICQGVAIYFDHTTIGPDELRIIKKIARDTCPDRIEDIVRKMYLLGDGAEVTTEWLVEKTCLSSTTISAVVNDLMPLGILKRTGGAERFSCSYTLGPDIRACIERGLIYREFREKAPEPRRVRIKRFFVPGAAPI